MKIIGHRGAAGLALENTLDGIEIARQIGVDAIELDIRATSDGELVLCHDNDLKRVSDSSAKIGELTLKELQSIKLKDGESTVPTLRQALRTAGKTPLIIELKQSGLGEKLQDVLADFPHHEVTVVSFKLSELQHLRELNPDLELYGLEHTSPMEIINWARTMQLNGVGINFWLLNPLTYFLMKHHKLDIYAYTLNNRLLVRFVQLLYPKVAICTNHPENFIRGAKSRLRELRKERAEKRRLSKS